MGKKCTQRHHPRRRRVKPLDARCSSDRRWLPASKATPLAPPQAAEIARFGGSLLVSKPGSFLASAEGIFELYPRCPIRGLEKWDFVLRGLTGCRKRAQRK